MTSRLHIEALRIEHLPALEQALRHEAVYAHIGGRVPTLEQFTRGLTRALAGPPAERTGERWLNYLVREAGTGRVLGRLEATVHAGHAEVAFLFDPSVWGRGYATEGLAWLHAELARVAGPVPCWATTVPDNRRCQALLQRAGYRAVPAAEAPHLSSYDDGDLVFLRSPVG
jgi:RimJ/RimL family protein N-acetyltransferase